MGHGAITYWKDGREVYDNVSCIYVFDDGVKMTFDSIISNKFYGLEEQIMGNLGTVEPERDDTTLKVWLLHRHSCSWSMTGRTKCLIHCLCRYKLGTGNCQCEYRRVYFGRTSER